MESTPHNHQAIDRQPVPAERIARSIARFEAYGDGVASALWYGVASSRLGKPVEKRKPWFQLLHRVVQQAIADDAALLIIPGTTAADWLSRAAQFYSCPTVTVIPEDGEHRDQLLAELADKLFVLRCRRSGKVLKSVLTRLPKHAADTLVAIWADADDAGQELLKAGAVGWWLYSAAEVDFEIIDQNQGDSDTKNSTSEIMPRRLPDIDGGWLVHCTRGRSGPLPGQSEAQWRDEVLLGGTGGAEMDAGAVLVRILKEKRLRAVQLAHKCQPVVCLSEMRLEVLLSRRTFRQHRGRWDYEPFGLALSRERLLSLGAQQVAYAESFSKSGLPPSESWRFQPIGKTFDWTEEREWRIPASIDLSRFSAEELVIFVANRSLAVQLTEFTGWPVILAPVNG